MFTGLSAFPLTPMDEHGIDTGPREARARPVTALRQRASSRRTVVLAAACLGLTTAGLLLLTRTKEGQSCAR
jgi:hypothetical protein